MLHALCSDGKSEEHGDLHRHTLMPSYCDHHGSSQITNLVLDHRRKRTWLVPLTKLTLKGAMIPAQKERRRRLCSSDNRELEQQVIRAAHQLTFVEMVQVILDRCMSYPVNCLHDL
jgi:hypothetical protein